jgi:hypothetical protein
MNGSRGVREGRGGRAGGEVGEMMNVECKMKNYRRAHAEFAEGSERKVCGCEGGSRRPTAGDSVRR